MVCGTHKVGYVAGALANMMRGIEQSFADAQMTGGALYQKAAYQGRTDEPMFYGGVMRNQLELTNKYQDSVYQGRLSSERTSPLETLGDGRNIEMNMPVLDTSYISQTNPVAYQPVAVLYAPQIVKQANVKRKPLEEKLGKKEPRFRMHGLPLEEQVNAEVTTHEVAPGILVTEDRKYGLAAVTVDVDKYYAGLDKAYGKNLPEHAENFKNTEEARKADEEVMNKYATDDKNKLFAVVAYPTIMQDYSHKQTMLPHPSLPHSYQPAVIGTYKPLEERRSKLFDKLKECNHAHVMEH